MDTADFASMLERFGASLGIEGLALDEYHSCMLAVRDVAFILQWGEAAQSVLIYASVGTLSHAEDEGALCRHLLEASCLGAGTGGFTLGVQPEMGTVILSGRMPGAALSEESLGRWVSAFVQQAEKWMGSLGYGGEAQQAAQPETESMGAFMASMLRV